MAERDRPALELTSEQQLADTVVRRFRLVPPVDVHALADEFADVEHDSIPGSCDGLVVGLDGRHRERPLIVLTQTSNTVRERFTVAHELGHVVLPWHLGANIACDVEADLNLETYLTRRAEAQANRFAADLLVPSSWLASVIDEEGTENVGRLLDALEDTQVSAHVACLTLVRQLPVGHVFAILNDDGRVGLGGISPGTAVEPPMIGSPSTRRLDRFANERKALRFLSREIVWWRFAQAEVGEDADIRSSKDVLTALLERHYRDPAKITATRSSFGGIVGSANNNAQLGRRFTEEEIFERLRRAFTKRRELPTALLDDPEFSLWLKKRAREVAGRDRPQGFSTD